MDAKREYEITMNLAYAPRWVRNLLVELGDDPELLVDLTRAMRVNPRQLVGLRHALRREVTEGDVEL